MKSGFIVGIIGLIILFVCIFIFWPKGAQYKERVVHEEIFKCYKGNIFSQLFKEPFEIIVFIFKDGTFYAFTNQEENKVSVPTMDFFEKEKINLADVVFIIHNHFGHPRFSSADIRIDNWLRRNGFKGYFCLYVQANDRVIVRE